MPLNQEPLARRLRDRETREIYADEHLNSYLASQLVSVREARGLTQKELADKLETTQSTISRMESIHYGNWTVSRLKKMAYALGCRLKVSLETFGSMVGEVEHLDRATLSRVDAEEDAVLFPERASIRRTMATPQPWVSPAPPAPEPVRWMQQRILPWLDRPEKDLDPLKAWLSGRNLPPVGDEFAPYDLICQAIPLDEFGSGDYFIALVERTAQLLAEQARNRLREPAEPGFHANLFRLTALLRDPRAFAEPLRLIYGELKAEEANLPVAGRAALLAGLVWNQFDDGLIEDWFEMAVNGSDVLPGNHLDGIRALRLVPKENGIPHYKALAKAVKVQEIRDDRTRPSTNEETRRLLMDLKRQELADSLKHAVELLLAGPAFAGWGYSTEKAFAEMLPTEWSLMALSDPSITEWRRRLLLGIASDDRCERVAARFNISGSVVVRAQYNVSPVIRTADQEWDLKLREAAAAASLAAVA